MDLYIIIFIFLVLLGTFQVIHKRPLPGQNKILIIICVAMFIFVSFRGMGFDYDHYRRLFKVVGTRTSPEGVDFGFEQLCQVLPSFRSLYIFFAAGTILPFYWVLKHKSDYCFFSLIIFYTTFMLPTVMGQMRQGMTVFIMLYAFYRWRDRKLIFILFVLFCELFHSSSIIALLFLIPLKRRYPFYIYLCFVAGAIVISNLISHVFASYINGIAMLDDTTISTKLNYYTKEETLMGIRTGFNAAVTIRCIVFVLVYSILKRDKAEDASSMNFYFLSIFLYLTFSFLPQLGARGTQYFAVLDLILIPFIIKSYNRHFRALLVAMFITISALRLNQFFTEKHNVECYIPYKMSFK